MYGLSDLDTLHLGIHPTNDIHLSERMMLESI